MPLRLMHMWQQVWPSMADVKACITPGSAVVKLIECATKHEGQLQVLALGTQGNHGAKALQTIHCIGHRGAPHYAVYMLPQAHSLT